MKMADIKVGMKLKSSRFTDGRVLTVTELTDKGFNYSCAPYCVKIGLSGGIPEFGTVAGGEYFGINGNSYCEEVT